MSFICKVGIGLVSSKVKRRVCRKCFRIFNTYFAHSIICPSCRKHAIPERFVVN